MTRENVEKMTDAELARNSAIYQHKADDADAKDDMLGFDRNMTYVEMIEDERERRAGRELSDGGK